MNLEVLSKCDELNSARPPIVLVHGAWHGAWCWEKNFLAYFSDRGWDTFAISLRGHGQSEGRSALRWAAISDYVVDLKQFIATLDRPPILVGHSMGGLVVQKYLESNTAVGGILLASVPVSGTLKFNLRLLLRHPLTWLTANLLLRPYLIIGKPEFAREWFFSPTISSDALSAHFSKLQNESFRAALDMLGLNLPAPSKVRSPIAVLGGEMDQIFTVAEVLATASAYGVKAKIFPNMAHNMMAEDNWEAVADWILTWASSITDARDQGINAA
ncbi:alpha/beta hydrolase [Zhongshania borealis]